MENIYIVKVGNKYLRINYHKAEFVLVQDIKHGKVYYSFDDAKKDADLTAQEGKYLKQKKKILKYEVSLVEETSM